MKSFIAIVILTLSDIFCASICADDALSLTIETKAGHALKQIGFIDTGRMGNASPEYLAYKNRFSVFDTTMKELEQSLDERTAVSAALREGDAIEAKIITIAYERKVGKELFDEIESTYYALPSGYKDTRTLKPAYGGTTGARSPTLQPAHIEPRYRYAWEYCTLKYARYSDCKDGAMARGTVALLTLADARSLIVWEFLYEQTVKEQPYNFTRTAYYNRMWSYPIDRGVRSLLRIYNFSKASKPKYSDWKEFETPGDFFVYRFGQQPLELQLKWKAALGTASKDGLAEDERQLLHRLIEFQPPGPQPEGALASRRLNEGDK